MDDKGQCYDAIPSEPDGDKSPCSAYCEVKTSFAYGREQPFNDPCPSCTLSQGEEVQTTTGWSFTFGANLGLPVEELETAFNIGASYSFQQAITFTTETTYSPPADYKGCGEWTFVPYLTQ
jgi:hypothetical protein